MKPDERSADFTRALRSPPDQGTTQATTTSTT